MMVTSSSLARSTVGSASVVMIAMKIEVGATHQMHKDVVLSQVALELDRLLEVICGVREYGWIWICVEFVS
jgi:hypothetical protein